MFYLKQTYAEEIFDFDGAANQVVGPPARRRAASSPDDVLRRIETLLEPYGVFTTTPRTDQASNRFLATRSRAGRVRHDHAGRSFWPWPRWCSTC